MPTKRELEAELENMKRELRRLQAPCQLVKDPDSGKFIVECGQEDVAKDVSSQLLRDGSLTIRLRKQGEDEEDK